AANDGDIKTMRSLIVEQGADVNAEDQVLSMCRCACISLTHSLTHTHSFSHDARKTPMSSCVSKEPHNLVMQLGWTPLFGASFVGDVAAMKLLIDNRANVTLSDSVPCRRIATLLDMIDNIRECHCSVGR